MKKILLIVILATGITGANHALAQRNPDPLFDIPDDKFGRLFTVELDRGNKMQVSVTDIHDLAYISNIDSIVKLFTADMALLRDKDTLTAPNTSKRIDYNMDVATAKKIRVRKTLIEGNYFAIINGSPVRLRMQQDTIVIFGKLPAQRSRNGKGYKIGHYFCVTFYLNAIKDLADYKDGRLNEKIRIIQQYYRDTWEYRNDEQLQLKKYPEITSPTSKGYVLAPKTFLLRKSVEIQNYKDHFIPSISCMPVFIKNEDFIRREIGVAVEAAFSFERTGAGTTKTRINVFTGIEYKVVPEVNYRSKIYPQVQLAYLVHRSGSLYDKNSFRFSPASFQFNHFYTLIQPAVYFSRFLKNITPSLRIIQRF